MSQGTFLFLVVEADPVLEVGVDNLIESSLLLSRGHLCQVAALGPAVLRGNRVMGWSGIGLQNQHLLLIAQIHLGLCLLPCLLSIAAMMLLMLPPEPGTSSAWQERRGSRRLPPGDNIQEVIYDDTVNRCLNICRVGTVGRH